MKKIFNKFIDFLFPKTCVFCGDFILSDEPSKYLCLPCYQKIKFIESSVCQKCGVPVNSNQRYCDRCSKEGQKIYYDFLRGIVYFEEPIKKCIHMLKYQGKEYLGKFLSEFFIQYIQKNNYLLNVDLLVPVPIHWTRKLKRGFNQSELLSRPIAEKFNIKYEHKNLFRKKRTKPQVKLNREERLSNINEAFAIRNSNYFTGKSILIIDDVSTTGETINQCAKVLRMAGAKNIFGLTLARDI
ncbi:MAG: ComF family protein [Endomicrobiia bacterium]